MTQHKAATKQNQDSWPQSRSVGSVTVKVYRRTRADGSFGYEVADYSEGARRLRSFPTAGKALDEARRIAGLMASGNAEAAQMTNREAATYGRAIELIRATGLPLELVAANYAKAFEILGADKIVAAAEYFKAHSTEGLTPRTVAEVVAEVLASKEGKRASNTIADLRARLNTFAEAFHCDIASVTTPDVQKWLDGLKCGDRTRLNYRNKVAQLFTFAERRNYIPKRGNPVADTERPEPPEGEITTYTAPEIEKLLAAASPEFLPSLALGAFAGLRSAEVLRLDWQDVDFERGHVKASGRKRGTPSRRFVPMTDNLRAWLQPHAKRNGFVFEPATANRERAVENFSDAQAATAKAAGVPWKKNALRHSFITYRVAEVQDVARVALECGNSVATIHKHYRELATAKEAARWFSIKPSAPANVVQMGKAGAA